MNSRFVSTPSNTSVNSRRVTSSNASQGSAGNTTIGKQRAGGGASSGARSVGSVGNASVTSFDLMDSTKNKNIAKRKRKEYAKDSRYKAVRRVVDGAFDEIVQFCLIVMSKHFLTLIDTISILT